MSNEREKGLIKEMPKKELLEDFIKGMSGKPTVVFNSDSGKFERTRPKPESDKIKP